MLSQFLNFSSNILVLDEIFDNLDSIGCQRVLDLISNKLLDVSSIFIVTHHSDIQIPNDNEIVIVKDGNGISKVLR
jgi:ABC-type multidrug transport system ATPase subunit